MISIQFVKLVLKNTKETKTKTNPIEREIMKDVNINLPISELFSFP